MLQTHTLSLSLSHTHTLSLTHTHTHTLSLSLSLSHLHTHRHTDTHTHTHTHTHTWALLQSSRHSLSAVLRRSTYTGPASRRRQLPCHVAHSLPFTLHPPLSTLHPPPSTLHVQRSPCTCSAAASTPALRIVSSYSAHPGARSGGNVPSLSLSCTLSLSLSLTHTHTVRGAPPQHVHRPCAFGCFDTFRLYNTISQHFNTIRRHFNSIGKHECPPAIIVAARTRPLRI